MMAKSRGGDASGGGVGNGREEMRQYHRKNAA